MARHRSVRGMNYDDDYDGYDEDLYGHSVEDDYGVSPSTAAQFMYGGSQRGHQQLSSFLENIGEQDEDGERLPDAGEYRKPRLTDTDEARLQSCLDEIRSIVGETVPEHVIIQRVLESDFLLETALDRVLNYQERGGGGGRQPEHQQQQQQPKRIVKGFNVPAEDPLQKRLKDEAMSGLTTGMAQMSFASPSEAKVGFNIKEPPKVKVQEATAAVAAPSPLSPERKVSMPKSGSSSDLNSLTSTPSRRESRTKPLDINILKEYSDRQAGKDLLNMVVIGHVDAGKSTLMGHLLFLLGQVNKRQMHKYETESKKQGKASFAYAWVLDETGEERERGITMDVGLTRFETDHRMVTLLDAPGHKDFIPNMISGAAQADVAILVIDATKGEFETGFESGGQTREHAILARSLGVTQLAVAVNKMDTVGWAQERFEEIVGKLKVFLKKTGFKDSDVDYVPCSGLDGENMVKRAQAADLVKWYSGPCLLEQIDKFKSPSRPIDKSFRMCVSDVFKGIGAGISICGRIESGSIVIGDRIIAMPTAETGIVKNISVQDEDAKWACAGDQSILVVTGIDQMKVNVGSVICSRTDPIKTATRFQARIIVFDIEVPITKGFMVLLHYQAVNEPAVIKKLISTLHKSTGEVLQKKPKCLTKNSNALVEIETSRPICIELYKDYKDLGRFMLRYSGHTIAAGLVTLIKES